MGLAFFEGLFTIPRVPPSNSRISGTLLMGNLMAEVNIAQGSMHGARDRGNYMMFHAIGNGSQSVTLTKWMNVL